MLIMAMMIFMEIIVLVPPGFLDEKSSSLNPHLALHRLLPGQRGTHLLFTSPQNLLLYLLFACFLWKLDTFNKRFLFEAQLKDSSSQCLNVDKVIDGKPTQSALVYKVAGSHQSLSILLKAASPSWMRKSSLWQDVIRIFRFLIWQIWHLHSWFCYCILEAFGPLIQESSWWLGS